MLALKVNVNFIIQHSGNQQCADLMGGGFTCYGPVARVSLLKVIYELDKQ